ncbi:MAG: DUF799 family lipoprotein [Nitrospira sp.]|nr:DUF799 family lipoprotein [Nitrospira sp.]
MFVMMVIGCKAAFDMAVYEDSLYDAYVGNGNARARAPLDQVILSSELVSARIPSGVYADQGVLFFREGKYHEAIERISKEAELYPEAMLFVGRLQALIRKADSETKTADLPHHHPPSILVLPSINKSGKSEAATAFDVTLSRQFVERGYYVFPFLATRLLLKETHLTAEDISKSELASLKSLTGADALLLVTILQWEKPWMLLSLIRVAAEYRLIDLSTGQDLWKSNVEGQYDSTVTGGAGGPVYVMATDLRVPARALTKKAVTASYNGLPAGPYH